MNYVCFIQCTGRRLIGLLLWPSKIFDFKYICLDTVYVCRVEFSDQEKAAIFFEVPISLEVGSYSLTNQDWPMILWLWILMQQCCTLLGTLKKKAWRNPDGVPLFFYNLFGPLHPLSKHRTPTWWLIFFFQFSLSYLNFSQSSCTQDSWKQFFMCISRTLFRLSNPSGVSMGLIDSLLRSISWKPWYANSLEANSMGSSIFVSFSNWSRLHFTSDLGFRVFPFNCFCYGPA